MGNVITNLFADIKYKKWNMSEEYKNRLKGLLRSLFQFDSADLDFGIYRIMNKKRDEIDRFIEKDLIDAVDEEFGKYTESKQANFKEEVEAIKAEIREKLGDDALDENGNVKKILVTTPFAKELAGKYEQKLAAMKSSDMTDQNKAEIFSHIYQFFSRYYDNGDFLSLRRYSQKEKYAIPYNGEEVVLHWANKDQYYIKTGEYFKNYSFKAGEYNINFQIRDAQSTTNNNKAENRFFILSSSEEKLVYTPENKTLTIFFEYRGLSKDEEKEYETKNIQEAIIGKINNFILSQAQDAGLKSVLAKIEKEKTLLEKHLRNYTKRNNTDYFIHKNLKRFLKQELDFYIKNEVFHLDDLGTENEVSLEQYVSRVKVMKRICLKIIDFLGQIEDFQKMLFEKKKFVLKTDYCMTIDNVLPELYPEIVKNKDQLNEWKVLYGAGEEKQSTITSFGSTSIDESYLKEHPFLVLDTKFFDREFKDRLLTSFDDLDEATGGIMIKSENWQALNLIQEKYREKVKCIYIDPPYNTGNDDGFAYKDNYQHSSWLTMMENRLESAKELIPNDGAIFTSIDDGEEARLNALQKIVFGDNNFVSNIIWQKKYSPQNDARWFSDNHDFVTCFSKNKEVWRPNLLTRTDEQDSRFKNPDNDLRGNWKSSDLSVKTYSAAYDYPITTPSGRVVNPPDGRCWLTSKEKMKELIADSRIWFGEDGNNVPSLKKFLSEVKKGVTPLTIWTYQEVGHNQEGKQEFKAMLAEKEEVFGTPKVIRLMKRIFTIGADSNSIILDFFAGSGTTAHAILNLNAENGVRSTYL